MVNPIQMGTKHKPKSCDFEGILDEGQNPRGFTAETCNGTARAQNNPGWNKNYKMRELPVEPQGAWENANRTGE
jgi:hypothetical protein